MAMNILTLKVALIGGSLASGAAGIYYGYPYISGLFTTTGEIQVSVQENKTPNKGSQSEKVNQAQNIPGNTDNAGNTGTPNNTQSGKDNSSMDSNIQSNGTRSQTNQDDHSQNRT